MSNTILTAAASHLFAHLDFLGYSHRPADRGTVAESVKRINQHATLHTFVVDQLGVVVVVKATSKGVMTIVSSDVPTAPAVDSALADLIADDLDSACYLESDSPAEPIDYQLDADDLAFAESVDRLNDGIDSIQTPAVDSALADPIQSLADSFVVASDPADWTKTRTSGVTSALESRETISSIDAETARLLDTHYVAVKRLGRNRHKPEARRITSPIRPSRIAVRLARMLALFGVSTSLFTS
jgi:hypothetical protein